MRTKIKHLLRDINQWSFFTMAIGLLIAIPLFAIVLFLFKGQGEMWAHIVKHFLGDYISNSLVLLFGTGILTFVFGVVSAWLVCNYDFPFRKQLEWLLFLPLAIPSYIVAYAYVGLFGNGGTLLPLLNGLGMPFQKVDMMNRFGLIWVLSVSLFPYVYAGTRSVFKSFPKQLFEASTLLGASRLRYVFRVALPLASPAIIGGLFLVFMEVLNDFGAAKYYGIQTFTTGIFRTWTALEDLQSAVYLSGILVVMVFSINSLVTWFRRNKSYALKLNPTQEETNRIALNGWTKYLCFIIVFIPVLAGFILPISQLLYWASITFETMFNTALFGVAAQSFGLALTAAFLIVCTALLLIFVSRWNGLPAFSNFKKVAVVGYVIPGAIIGIGVIRSSQTVIDFFNNTFHLEIGYLFYGSSFILLYAYIFRFLAVAFNPIDANFLKLGKNMHEASYTLGISKLKTAFNIEIPLLKTTLLSAFLLVFIDILKELPLTLILKPYHLETLAVQAYAYADDERVPEAALPALLLVLVIVLLMWGGNRINTSLKNLKTKR
ncbi:MAG: ABC transporter permease [Flavicella sp.]